MENEFKIERKGKNSDLNKLLLQAKYDPNAQFLLATKYYNGNDVEQNIPEAFKWFKIASENGNPQAQYNLAVMYEEGEGVNANIEEAIKWYQKSAEQGYQDSIEALKEIIYEDENENVAIKYIMQSVKQENISIDSEFSELDSPTILESIYSTCKYFCTQREIANLEFKQNLENLEEKIKKRKEGEHITKTARIILSFLLLPIFIIIVAISLIILKENFMLCILLIILIYCLFEFILWIYKAINKKNIEKKAEEYREIEIKKCKEKLEEKLTEIDSKLKLTIKEIYPKYATDMLIEKIFKNLPYLYFVYISILYNKANNFMEATNLYKQNEWKIEEIINTYKQEYYKKENIEKKYFDMEEAMITSLIVSPENWYKRKLI